MSDYEHLYEACRLANKAFNILLLQPSNEIPVGFFSAWHRDTDEEGIGARAHRAVNAALVERKRAPSGYERSELEFEWTGELEVRDVSGHVHVVATDRDIARAVMEGLDALEKDHYIRHARVKMTIELYEPEGA